MALSAHSTTSLRIPRLTMAQRRSSARYSFLVGFAKQKLWQVSEWSTRCHPRFTRGVYWMLDGIANRSLSQTCPSYHPEIGLSYKRKMGAKKQSTPEARFQDEFHLASFKQMTVLFHFQSLVRQKEGSISSSKSKKWVVELPA